MIEEFFTKVYWLKRNIYLMFILERMSKNICLITIDSLRADHLGCYGYHRNTSPNIDKLAKKGIIFKNAFTTNTATLGSFFSIFTSKYPFIGYTDSKPINEYNISFVERLVKNGYNTAGFHSNPHLLRNMGFSKGYKKYYDFLDTNSNNIENKKPKNKKNRIFDIIKRNKILKKSLKKVFGPSLKRNYGYEHAFDLNQKIFNWIEDNKRDNIFLWIHYMDVHMPYVPEMKYLERIGINYSISTKEMWKLRDKMYYFPESKKISEGDRQKLIDLYDAEIRYTDEAIGKLIRKFESLDLLNDLFLIITADHGEEFLEHGSFGHSANLYEEVMKIPLIIYGLKNLTGKPIETNVNHLDIAPTIANISNISTENFLGENPFDYIKEENLKRYVLAEDLHFGKKKKLRVVRTKDFKYIWDEFNDTHEIYNLKKDPKEQTNLVDNHKDIPQRLKKILDNHIKSENDLKKKIESKKMSKIIRQKHLNKF